MNTANKRSQIQLLKLGTKVYYQGYWWVFTNVVGGLCELTRYNLLQFKRNKWIVSQEEVYCV